ncbi:hypothetical protein Aperf_G00000094756 [Anoplocephala perfoliata]
MSITPKRDDRDMTAKRRSLIDSEFPQMSLMPFDQVFDWVERSRQSLHEDIMNMHRNLFSLEPFSAMEAAMNKLMREMSAIKPHEFQPEKEFTQPGELDFLKDAYEVGKDGKLYFKVYFNVKNFDPKEISVRAENNRLIVQAQKSAAKGGAAVHESVGRSLPLPPSVDRDHINATVTSDDVLVVEAPVNEPNYKSIKLNSDHAEGLAIEPLQVKDKQLAVTNKEGLQIMTAEDGSKKMHLELKVDPHFEPKDLKVWAKGNKVYVHGATSKKEETDKLSRSEFHQFCRAFVTPEVVDASKAQAEIDKGHLVVEAPLFK